ncbi:MAG: hypothetical protein FWD57_13675, partial [Polyangiaceae bacterium]|nr:hypothetical protein [Polyangiaceae bacterium]
MYTPRVCYHKCLALIIAICAMICVAGGAAGAPVIRPERTAVTPVPLKAWNDWVLDQHGYMKCPLLSGADGTKQADFLCAWPGELTLRVGDNGVEFAIRWQVASESWIPLPGDSRNWPQEVTVGGTAQPVLLNAGNPSLRLNPGEHSIRGKIIWEERPQSLTVPQSIVRISMSIDGRSVQPLQRKNEQVT